MYFRPDNPRRRSLVASGAHRECRLLKINPVARNTPAIASERARGRSRARVTCNVCTKIAAISWPATEAVSGVRCPATNTTRGAVVTNELLSSPLDPAYCSPILILTARRYAGRWHRGNTRRTCGAMQRRRRIARVKTDSLDFLPLSPENWRFFMPSIISSCFAHNVFHQVYVFYDFNSLYECVLSELSLRVVYLRCLIFRFITWNVT